MLIKNRVKLSTSKLKSDVLSLLDYGLSSISPESIVHQVHWDSKKRVLRIKDRSFNVKGRIFIIGAGIGVDEFVSVLERIFEDDLTAGIVLSDNPHWHSCRKVHVLKANPLKITKLNLRHSQYLLDLKKSCAISKDDLVLSIFNSNAHMMLESLEVPISDFYNYVKLAKSSDFNLKDFNAFRDLVSSIRAGGLALHFQPAKIISLNLFSSASNSFFKFEEEGFIDSNSNLIEKLGLGDKISFEEGVETKFPCVEELTLFSNSFVLKELSEYAKKLGYNPKVISDSFNGSLKNISINFLHDIFVKNKSSHDCYIFGAHFNHLNDLFFSKKLRSYSEFKNHYFILSAVDLLKHSVKDWAISSVSTGTSINLKHSGIIFDSRTSMDDNIFELLDSNVLVDNNSSLIHGFFKKSKSSLIELSGSGANVSEIGILLRK